MGFLLSCQRQTLSVIRLHLLFFAFVFLIHKCLFLNGLRRLKIASFWGFLPFDPLF
jgi:hypothetical protein